MIRQLMKRDPGWPSVPILTLASAVFCVLWHFLAAGANGSSVLIFISAFAAIPFTCGVVATAQQGDTRFQAALPVTVRQVYLARVLSMIGLSWLPAAVSVVIALALPNPAIPIATLVEFVSVWTLAMVGTQSAAIRGFAIPGRLLIAGPGFLWMFGAGLAPISGWLSGENRVAFVMLTLICWLASAAIFQRTWNTVPKSFQTAPLKASPVTVSVVGRAPSRWMPTIPWLPVLRSVLRWGGLELLFLFVFMSIGAMRTYYFFIFGAEWSSARPRVRWLFALPVPRRVLLTAMLIPTILACTGGYLVSVHLPFFPTGYERGISVRALQELPQWSHYSLQPEPGCRTLNVLPSLEFWVQAKGGKAPLIQAPWGETFQPPVFRKSGFDIFNPYAVGCGNSERFLDWQFNRATIAVYGRPIPRKKDEASYEIGSYGVVTSARTQLVTVAAIAGFAMLAMIVSMLNDWDRFRRIARPVRVTIMSLAALAAFGAVILDTGDKLVLTQWLSWTLPPSLFGAIAAVIPPLAILCWILDTLFRQVELVDKPEPSMA